MEKFPGRRSLRKNPIDTLEQALLADGVPLDKLYPLDVDRAFKSLDKIKPHVEVWWTGGAQSTQLLQSGEVDMITGWNARLASGDRRRRRRRRSSGTKGSIRSRAGAFRRAGPRADAARQFIRFCSDRGASGGLYRGAGVWARPTSTPTRHRAGAGQAAADARRTTCKQMRVANENWWSENRAAVTERFNSWLLT